MAERIRLSEKLEYTPLDNDFFEDPDIIRLKKKFGSDGIVTLIKIWNFCYGKKGYFYEYTANTALDIAEKINIPSITEELVQEIIDYLLDNKLLNKEKFDRYSVLTSHGIQKRYEIVAWRREKVLERMKKSALYIPDEDKFVTNYSKIVTNQDGFVTNQDGFVINSQAVETNQSGFVTNGTQVSKTSKRREEREEKVSNKFAHSVISDFSPPLLEEIYDYALEKHYEINPDLFFSHYQANGWKIGQNKMTDWKSAVDKWVIQDRAEKTENQKISPNSSNLPKNGQKIKSKAQIQLESLPEFTVVEAKGRKFKKDSSNSFLTETGVVFVSDFVKMFPKFDVKGVELPENFSPGD